MAKKQTRRCVSINCDNYEAVKQEAARRGMTITALVELALGAIGVPVVAHPQQSPELARETAERRAARATERRSAAEAAGRGPSRERQLLGDGVANALGL